MFWKVNGFVISTPGKRMETRKHAVVISTKFVNELLNISHYIEVQIYVQYWTVPDSLKFHICWPLEENQKFSIKCQWNGLKIPDLWTWNFKGPRLKIKGPRPNAPLIWTTVMSLFILYCYIMTCFIHMYFIHDIFVNMSTTLFRALNSKVTETKIFYGYKFYRLDLYVHTMNSWNIKLQLTTFMLK